MNSHAYNNLLTLLRKERKQGLDNAKMAATRHLIITNWRTGKIIHQHLLSNNASSVENALLIQRISKALSIQKNYLYDMIRFYRKYPRLPDHSNATWSSYLLLMSVKSDQKRKKYERLLEKKSLTFEKIKALIRKDNACEKQKSLEIIPLSHLNKPQLAYERGQLYYYKVIAVKNIPLPSKKVLIDIGFGNRKPATISYQQNIIGGLYVRTAKTSPDYQIKIQRPHPEWLYTFKAYCDRVVDADTLVVHVDCGMDVWHKNRLRLRGINAPEIHTDLGKKAKAFVQKVLTPAKFIIIKTYWEGKYGRMLADIFYLPKCDDPHKVAEKGIFLNQQLIDEGLAEIA